VKGEAREFVEKGGKGRGDIVLRNRGCKERFQSSHILHSVEGRRGNASWS